MGDFLALREMAKETLGGFSMGIIESNLAVWDMKKVSRENREIF